MAAGTGAKGIYIGTWLIVPINIGQWRQPNSHHRTPSSLPNNPPLLCVALSTSLETMKRASHALAAIVALWAMAAKFSLALQCDWLRPWDCTEDRCGDHFGDCFVCFIVPCFAVFALLLSCNLVSSARTYMVMIRLVSFPVPDIIL